MRTATSHRWLEAEKSAIFWEAPASSESTTTGFSPVISVSSRAYARAAFWSVAITRPPASGMSPERSTRSRASAARRTCGIHSPDGSSAVRHAWAMTSWVTGSPRRTASSSPAEVRHRVSPE